LYIAGFADAVLDCLEAVPVCAHPQNSTGKNANAVRKFRFMGSSVVKIVLCMFVLAKADGRSNDLHAETCRHFVS
jgi:hypothetical protein